MNRSVVNYEAMQVLVAISNKQLAEYVWHFLKDNGAHNVQVVHHSRDAVMRMTSTLFTHFILGHHLDDAGGPDFTRFIRMCEGPVSEAPVLMIMSNPSTGKVVECRDSGVNEVMVTPITGKLLEMRLHHMAVRPKKFIRSATYIGPDRRRPNAPLFEGVDKRKDGVVVDTDQRQPAE
ncbi:MAG: hypothetical protein AB3N28_11625 [Kordiimonas sp.]